MITALGRLPLNGSGGGPGAFCRWSAALGEAARLITIETRAERLEPLRRSGVEVCPVEPGGALGGVAWMGTGLLHLPHAALAGAGYPELARAGVEAVREEGGLVSVDLSGLAGGHDDPARLALRVAAMRPSLLFLTPAEAEALAAPLEGLAEIPVVRLPGGACHVYGRRLPGVPGAASGAWTAEAAEAFTAAFCAAHLEGVPPLEAAARALVLAAQVTAGPALGGVR